MSYFKDVNLHENIAHVSTLNSNTANVAASTTWTGTFEEVTNQTAIQWVGKYDREVKMLNRLPINVQHFVGKGF